MSGAGSSLWKWYAGNTPAGVVLAWTAALVVGWPLMLAATLGERFALRVKR
jgi:hypothetical protein